MTAVTGTNHETRVNTAGAGLALAYLRLLVEGDGARASIVLGQFQLWWNEHRGVYQDQAGAYRDEVAGPLAPTGGLDRATQIAVIQALQPTGIVGRVQMPTGAPGMVELYQGLARPPEGSMLWGAYRAARGTSIGAAGTQAMAWADDTVLGISGDGFDDLMDELASGPPAGATGSGDQGVVTLPEQDVVGLVPRQGRRSYWPWAVAGVGAAVLGGVLIYRMRRGRRR